jgi:hypothetical protein
VSGEGTIFERPSADQSAVWAGDVSTERIPKPQPLPQWQTLPETLCDIRLARDRLTPQSWQIVIKQLLPATLLGAAAFALVLVITDPPGPGLDPDALSYMGAAESVVAHGEYRVPRAKWTSADSTEPLAHFPPGYSTVLALPLRFGMTPAQGARLVQATAAFVTVTTLVLLVSAVASATGGILLAVALFAMTSMHEVHVSVLSEPFYLACMVLVLAAMVLTPDRPLRAAIPAAVGVMTRYAGASLVGAVALWALVQPGRWVERVRRAALALVPALMLQGVWVLRTRAVAGTSEIREFALYGNLGPTLEQGGRTLAAWLIPDAGADYDPIPYRPGLALAAGFALAVLVGLGAWRAWASARAARDARPLMTWRLFTAASLLLVCYLGLVVVSRIVADPLIPLDQRMLAPALLLVMTMAATGLTLWWGDTRLRVARVVVAAALIAWWYAAATATRAEALSALSWGSDFAGQQWRESDVLAWARSDGAGAPLYSNWPAAVYFHLHRPAHELPYESDARTMAAFADTVRVRGGRVLLFDVRANELAPNDSVIKARGMHTVARLQDGVVLGADR